MFFTQLACRQGHRRLPAKSLQPRFLGVANTDWNLVIAQSRVAFAMAVKHIKASKCALPHLGDVHIQRVRLLAILRISEMAREGRMEFAFS